MTLCVVFQLIACYFYLITLEGGDLDNLKEKVPKFALFVFFNIGITLIVFIAISCIFHIRLRILN